MGAFQNYPYADVHQLNLDWIIKEVKEVKDKEALIDSAVEEAEGYADDAKEEALRAKGSADDSEENLNTFRDEVALWEDGVEALASQVDTNKNNIEVESARIDAIISGTTPDANAELIDIRVGANGVTYASAGDAVRTQVSDLTDAIVNDNSMEVLRNATKNNGTVNNVTFTWSGNQCTISGTATANVTRAVFSSSGSLPSWLTNEKRYYVKYHSDNVRLRIIGYVSGVAQSPYLVNGFENTSFVLPSTYDGIVIQFIIPSGTAVSEVVEISILTALRNLDLQEMDGQIVSNYDGFISDIGDISVLDVETEKYGNCFPVCVHHDNFFRTIVGDQWKIGTNGSASFPMDYTSPRPDYATVDDGFRITLNYLTNDTSVTVARGIRLIDNVGDSRTFMVEMGAPSKVNNRSALCVVDFENLNFYKVIRITYDQPNDRYRVFLRQVINQADQTEVAICNISSSVNNFKLLFTGGKLYVYADDTLMFNGYDLYISQNRGIGIAVEKTRAIELPFFNVFYFRRPITVNPNFAYDSNSKTYAYVSHESVPTTPAYAWDLVTSPARFSQYASRFEVHKTDPYVDNSPRTENVSPGPFRNNLRKVHVSFDVYCDTDYVFDTAYDVHFQMHDLVDSSDSTQRNPNLLIGTENDHWFITVRGWYGKNDTKPTLGLLPDEEDQTFINIGNIEIGKWTHFDIYYKEGYMIGHNPLTVVYINGELVYKTHALNAYNRPRGTYCKYGIYKASWKSLPSLTDERVIVFDNFKYEY